MNREELLQRIQTISFAMEDVKLYLDTHLADKAALEYYEAYKKIRTKAVNQYNHFFGPLDSYNVKREDMWIWNARPWPWEGEGEQ